MSTEQLEALSTTIKDLQAATTAAQAQAKTLRSTLSSLNSTLSTADLVSSVSALEAEKAGIEKRLTTVKTGKAKKVTVKEREMVEAEWKKWTGVAKRREKIVGEMWKIIEDVVGEKEKREEVREALGLDE
jgi:26S proteasome regulatory subunit (ATPase 3-interacting protein)